MRKALDVYVTKEFYNNLIEPTGKTYRILDHEQILFTFSR